MCVSVCDCVCMCVRNSLLCKFVPQKLQLWTTQMLTNVEAAAPFFETEGEKKAAIKAAFRKKWHAFSESLNPQCVVYYRNEKRCMKSFTARCFPMLSSVTRKSFCTHRKGVNRRGCFFHCLFCILLKIKAI